MYTATARFFATDSAVMLLLGMRAFVFFRKDMNSPAARLSDDAAVAADPGVRGPRGSSAASPPPAAAPACSTVSAK